MYHEYGVNMNMMLKYQSKKSKKKLSSQNFANQMFLVDFNSFKNYNPQSIHK
jgi:hypothetical protein